MPWWHLPEVPRDPREAIPIPEGVYAWREARPQRLFLLNFTSGSQWRTCSAANLFLLFGSISLLFSQLCTRGAEFLLHNLQLQVVQTLG